MSQFNAPVRRTSGGIDVYTGLLVVALLVLVTGVALIAMRNIEVSGGSGQGGPFKLVSP